MGMLPKSSELTDQLLGTSEMEVQRNFDMFVDMLVIVAEDRDLNDPENNPDSVDLYQKLFGDGD